MKRKGKKQPQEYILNQSVQRTGVQGMPFDLVLRFTDKGLQPEIFMDENVKLVLEGLLDNFGTILVKVNWFAEGLTIIAPNELPPNASVASPEGLESMVESDLKSSTDS